MNTRYGHCQHNIVDGDTVYCLIQSTTQKVSEEKCSRCMEYKRAEKPREVRRSNGGWQ